MKIIPTLLATLTVLFNTGCLSNSGGWGSSIYDGPQVQVPMPSSLRLVERTLLPEFTEALKDSGYQPVNGPAEYVADFRINEGPINAETNMQLTRNGQTVASAQARQGGLTKVLQGSKYAEQSFYRCLQEFENKLPRQRGANQQQQPQNYQSSYGYGNQQNYRNNNNNPGYDRYGAGSNNYQQPQEQPSSNWWSGW